jgi:hypothetical protein
MLPLGTLEAGSTGKDLRSIDRLCRSAMSDADIQRYVQHSLACIGDGLSTIFRSTVGECAPTSLHKATKNTRLGCQEGQWLLFHFLSEQAVSTVTFKWNVEPAFTQEILQMSYDILEKDRDWIGHSSAQVEPVGDTLVIRLELDHPSSLVAARAVVGAGVHGSRPPWAVVGCVVETA